jgi:hypothetical protein
MNAKRIVIFSVFGGVLITVLTGLVPSTPPMLVGAMWYGYPLAWLFRLVISPEYFPWRVDLVGLLGDVVVWSVVVTVVLFIVKKISG